MLFEISGALSACDEMNMEMVIIKNFDQMEPLRQVLPKGEAVTLNLFSSG
jgi:hypothetical protein